MEINQRKREEIAKKQTVIFYIHNAKLREEEKTIVAAGQMSFPMWICNE